MVLDVQRQVVDVGNRLIFEQITPALRQQFVKNVTPILTNVQSRQGLQQFKVICDETNNTATTIAASQFIAEIQIRVGTIVREIVLSVKLFFFFNSSIEMLNFLEIEYNESPLITVYF
jgi:hypothetical protein